MRSTLVALRTPLIRFLGKRTVPKVDHSPRAHPEAPGGELPSSFAQYRSSAQTHGPLSRNTSTKSTGAAEASFLAISELPARFHYSALSEAELDCINSGGAEVVF